MERSGIKAVLKDIGVPDICDNDVDVGDDALARKLKLFKVLFLQDRLLSDPPTDHPRYPEIVNVIKDLQQKEKDDSLTDQDIQRLADLINEIKSEPVAKKDEQVPSEQEAVQLPPDIDQPEEEQRPATVQPSSDTSQPEPEEEQRPSVVLPSPGTTQPEEEQRPPEEPPPGDDQSPPRRPRRQPSDRSWIKTVIIAGAIVFGLLFISFVVIIPGSKREDRGEKTLFQGRKDLIVPPGTYSYKCQTANGWYKMAMVWPAEYEEFDFQNEEWVEVDPYGTKITVRAEKPATLAPLVKIPNEKLEYDGVSDGYHYKVWSTRREIRETEAELPTLRDISHRLRENHQRFFSHPRQQAQIDDRVSQTEERLDHLEEWQQSTDERLENLEQKVDVGFQTIGEQLGGIKRSLQERGVIADDTTTSTTH